MFVITRFSIVTRNANLKRSKKSQSVLPEFQPGIGMRLQSVSPANLDVILGGFFEFDLPKINAAENKFVMGRGRIR
jgi:hypothetical protein